jgi:transcriptional regulator with XRE-family HTH domain/quercetin dioxygenase-like cupin family protein
MPAYASHSTDYETLRIGEQIHAERQRQGLTLQDIADRAKVAVSRLSQIENGRHIPDTVQAAAIAEALGVSLELFLPPEVSIPYVISRDEEMRANLAQQASSVTLPALAEHHWSLAHSFIGRHLEPRFTRILPGGQQFCYHHEYEFLFVLSGVVEFTSKAVSAVQTEELERGDCIYFCSSVPHRVRSLGRDAAECIQVLASGSAPLLLGQDPHADGSMIFNDNDGDDGRGRAIGRELMMLRENRGWTVDQLARMVGLKARQLRQIEDGTRRLPLDVMIRLARTLGKATREFVRDTRSSGPHYFIQRSQEMGQLKPRPRRMPTDRDNAPTPNVFYPLASGFPTELMYPYLIRVRNVDTETLARHEHHGEEFLYILDGQLEVTTYEGQEQVMHVLRSGDSCYLDSSVPHFVRGLTRSPYSTTSAEVLDVFWCPLGESYLFSD